MLPTILKGAGVFDIGLFALSQINADLFSTIFKFCNGKSPEFGRTVGFMFLALGICRLHGGLHPNEKGAYRVFLWSFIVEVLYFSSNFLV